MSYKRNMPNKRNNARAHYNPELKELTVSMWLEGKSEWEIERAVNDYLYRHSRHRRGRSRENVKRSSRAS